MGTPVVLGDRVLVATTTTGTGTYSLGSAVTGYLDLATAGVVSGSRVAFVVVDSLTAPTAFEIAEGVYTSGSPGTLTRAQIRRNTTGGTAAVNWGAGTKYLMLAPNAANLPLLDTDGSLNVPGAVTLGGDPTSALHAATKQYVDAATMRVEVTGAVAQVEFGIPAGWSAARFDAYRVAPATATAILSAQVRRAGQGAYDAANYVNVFDGSYSVGAGGGVQSPITAMQLSNPADTAWPMLTTGTVDFGAAAVKASCIGTTLNVYGANGSALYTWGTYAPTAGACDRLRFFFSSGNIASGIFTLSRLA